MYGREQVKEEEEEEERKRRHNRDEKEPQGHDFRRNPDFRKIRVSLLEEGVILIYSSLFFFFLLCVYISFSCMCVQVSRSFPLSCSLSSSP